MYEDKLPIEDYLMHVGVDHTKSNPGSGRYVYGSGENPFQHYWDFRNRVDDLRKQNPTFKDEEGTWGPKGKIYTGDTAVAHLMGLSSSQFRTQISLSKDEERMDKYLRAKALHDSGHGYTEIARKLGLPNESSARSLLNSQSKFRMEQAVNTANFIKKNIDEKGLIDVGEGVEDELGISKEKLKSAVAILEMQGYVHLGGRMPNITDPTGKHKTTLSVMAPPGTPKSAIYSYDIHSLRDYTTRDNGETFEPKFVYPESMDINRLAIRYAEDGGKERDGLIEIRRGCPDLDLKESNYAQIRILVDNDKYLKGMAVYSDGKDMPDGVDVLFNTNKTKDVEPRKVLKSIKEGDNPFGSSIKDIDKGGQYWYIDKNGERKLGLINKRADEGDWEEWQNKVPAQFLSKQSYALAKRQLDLAIEEKQAEYNDIMSLNNNTVKKELLNTFANDCDSASVHLYAAALPRQRHQVMLPVPSMKEDEVYAPNFENGEKVALIRYPHSGTFEIPICTVNNKFNKDPIIKSIGKNTKDCVGVSAKVAERLSGADFDGDTVMVIPYTVGKYKIVSKPYLEQLKNADGSTFDPKTAYATKEVINPKTGKTEYINANGYKIKVMNNTQTEMGKISNLITDMTIKNATNDEIANAVKYSMVVIDAEKHKLDWRTCKQDCHIDNLKKRYQEHINDFTGKESYGASTLISRAKGEVEIPIRQGTPKVNIKGTTDYDSNRPEGSLIFKNNPNDTRMVIKNPKTGKEVDVRKFNDGKYYYNQSPVKDKKDWVLISDMSKVKTKKRTESVSQMSLKDDARSLISDYHAPIEELYANYANAMKAMANKARKTAYTTKDIQRDRNAALLYAKEEKSLKDSLRESTGNKPKERMAQALAWGRIKVMQNSNPDMSKKEVKKLRQQQLEKARQEVGAYKKKIKISEKEWEAIQSGAISKTLLKQILANTDLDDIREKATPIERKTVTEAMKSRILSMEKAGKTNAQIANALGLSVSTVFNVINPKKGE